MDVIVGRSVLNISHYGSGGILLYCQEYTTTIQHQKQHYSRLQVEVVKFTNALNLYSQ